MSDAAKKRFHRLLELVQSGALHDADKALADALKTTPKDPNILHLAALTAENLADNERAILLYKRTIAAHPHWFEATMNYCRLLGLLGEHTKAIPVLSELEKQHPSRPEIKEALARYSQTVGDISSALSYWKTLTDLFPSHQDAWSNYYFCKKQTCDWSAQPDEGNIYSPQMTVVFFDNPVLQRQRAEDYCKAKYSLIKPLPKVSNYFHDKRRVGYLSSDFYNHATSRLIAELFSLHDKSRFEIYAYSYGIDDKSPLRQRLKDDADHFIELNALSPRQCADRIRDDEIDILIDMKGHTHGGRLEILAYKPAPVQIHWLGYPGTTGATFIDAFIADPITVPKGTEGHFTENILRMPHCYQINDREKQIAEAKPKKDYGLPDNSIVLASFNQSYKLTQDMFALWCDIMRDNLDTVLWLLESNPYASQNIRAAAARNGIDPSRFIFAPHAPQEEHLARYSHVDVALDTFPVGGHTTTSDALWAGAPVITMIGHSFVSRVAASLLNAVNLGYLVAANPEQYRNEVVKLINAPDKRAEIRNHLLSRRTILPLFDTPLFVNAFEKLLLEIS